jgi:hypothetical protein
MKNLNRQNLRNLIKLEIKNLMDEDTLMPPPKLGEPYYTSSLYGADDIESFDHDHGDEEECDVCSAKQHSPGCDCPVCAMKNIGLYESCGCGGSSSSYEEEYDLDHNSALQTLVSNDGDVDLGFNDHEHSSYMALPQLTKIAKYASSLLELVDENEQLEDWQESKIAQISQMIGDVYHSIEYDEVNHDDHDQYTSISSY